MHVKSVKKDILVQKVTNVSNVPRTVSLKLFVKKIMVHAVRDVSVAGLVTNVT